MGLFLQLTLLNIGTIISSNNQLPYQSYHQDYAFPCIENDVTVSQQVDHTQQSNYTYYNDPNTQSASLATGYSNDVFDKTFCYSNNAVYTTTTFNQQYPQQNNQDNVTNTYPTSFEACYQNTPPQQQFFDNTDSLENKCYFNLPNKQDFNNSNETLNSNNICEATTGTSQEAGELLDKSTSLDEDGPSNSGIFFNPSLTLEQHTTTSTNANNSSYQRSSSIWWPLRHCDANRYKRNIKPKIMTECNESGIKHMECSSGKKFPYDELITRNHRHFDRNKEFLMTMKEIYNEKKKITGILKVEKQIPKNYIFKYYTNSAEKNQQNQNKARTETCHSAETNTISCDSLKNINNKKEINTYGKEDDIQVHYPKTCPSEQYNYTNDYLTKPLTNVNKNSEVEIVPPLDNISTMKKSFTEKDTQQYSQTQHVSNSLTGKSCSFEENGVSTESSDYLNQTINDTLLPNTNKELLFAISKELDKAKNKDILGFFDGCSMQHCYPNTQVFPHENIHSSTHEKLSTPRETPKPVISTKTPRNRLSSGDNWFSDYLMPKKQRKEYTPLECFNYEDNYSQETFLCTQKILSDNVFRDTSFIGAEVLTDNKTITNNITSDTSNGKNLHSISTNYEQTDYSKPSNHQDKETPNNSKEDNRRRFIFSKPSPESDRYHDQYYDKSISHHGRGAYGKNIDNELPPDSPLDNIGSIQTETETLWSKYDKK
ncbi:hypothetical protein SLOPH_963 [Spraguea lophii 42_110]|uniref:Uncharacterized protein n=1 Tax=Spraguea lophii (strain 42_110) TaxID=1358809 RepID=S7XIS1_SPRLO|nr:hypothetical protein SLOPH_963 [Spraguea lophii 42_110]